MGGCTGSDSRLQIPGRACNRKPDEKKPSSLASNRKCRYCQCLNYERKGFGFPKLRTHEKKNTLAKETIGDPLPSC